MYTALLIDDEEPARRAIKALGAWEMNRVSVLLEADNGKRGLELLAAHQPDIVFVDMRMPLLGGTEFLERARESSAAQFIVISGFDKFEYTRGAIQSGALDYLLKPIKRAELNHALEKAVANIERNKARQSREASQVMLQNISAPLVKEKIFASIIDQNGRFHQIKELEEWLGAATGELFYTAVLMGLNLSEVCRTKFFGDTHACYFALTNAANELLKDIGRAFSFKSHKEEQELVAVLSCAAPIDPATGQRELEKLLLKLQETFGLQAIAGFSLAPYPLEKLNQSYQASKALLLQANMLQPQPVVSEQAPAAAKQARPSILERKELLYHSLEAGSAMHALQVFRDYLRELRDGGCFRMEDMLKTVAELRLVTEQLGKDAKVKTEGAEAAERSDPLFAEPVADYETFRAKALAFAEKWIESVLQGRKPRERVSAEKIKEYIELHYFEDISIAYFTETYYLSKEHLLRLFKQKYGCGIYEYVLHVRMEKARELLADPSLKIQTVCQKVGYHEQNYFSKAFKKHFGVSPQEYRQRLAER